MIERVKELLDTLNREDIYSQPLDLGHLSLTNYAFAYFADYLIQNETVLDIGCGQGNAKKALELYGLKWTGVNIGEDYKICTLMGYDVIESDMTFLDLPENSYDLIVARHILEHSPMPLITLMNWHKIAIHHLCLVLPNPNHYEVYGQNHYSVLYENQWLWLLARAGWRTMRKKINNDEYWFYCLKDKPRKYAPYEKTEYDEKEALT